MRGLVPVAYAVFALVTGVFFGTLLRRTVPAMAATLVVVVFAQIASPLWVRPHLIPPSRESVTVTEENLAGIGWRGSADQFELNVAPANPGDWVLVNRLLDPAGRPVTAIPAELGRCFPPPGPRGEKPRDRPDRAAIGDCFRATAAAGYRQELVYQPASRFWALQWAETGVFLGLAGLLAWACFARIRRLS
jgi:hypothetical protein